MKKYHPLTFCYEKVQHCYDNSVATKHIITTCPYALQGHSESGPNHDGSIEFGGEITIRLKQCQNYYLPD